MLQFLMPLMKDDTPHHWSSDSKAEIEFILQWGAEIIPVEVKAENCVSGRSLSVYNEKYHPKERIRFSFLNLQHNSGLLSCPSLLAQWFDRFLTFE